MRSTSHYPEMFVDAFYVTLSGYVSQSRASSPSNSNTRVQPVLRLISSVHRDADMFIALFIERAHYIVITFVVFLNNKSLLHAFKRLFEMQ